MQNWRITQYCVGAQMLLCALLLGAYGAAESGTSLLIRATAWISALLFMVAFGARPLRQFVKTAATKWLLRNRRYVGASAAFAQLLHGFALLWGFFGLQPSPYGAYDPGSIVGGGLGFALYFAMGLTSNDAAVQKLGLTNWRRLHTVGGYYIWFVFTFTFASGALVPVEEAARRGATEVLATPPALLWFFTAAFAALLLLRIAARVAGKIR